MLTVVVGHNGRLGDGGLTGVGTALVVVELVALTLDDDLLTDLDVGKDGDVVHDDRDQTRLVNEVEAVAVDQGRTDDALDHDLIANLCLDGILHVGSVHNGGVDDGDLKGLGGGLVAQGGGDGDGSLTGVLALHDQLALGLHELHGVLVGGGVGNGHVLKAQQLGGDRGGQLQHGVAGVLGLEEIHDVVLQDELGSLGGVELVALVQDGHGEEAEGAGGAGGLGVQRGDVDGADLALEGAEPLEVITVALGIGVVTGLAVEIEEVVVGKAVAGNLLDQGVDLVHLGGDILGDGGAQQLLDGQLLSEAEVDLRDLAVILHQDAVGELVAALVAELLGACDLGVQDPVVLGTGHGHGVADLHTTCGVTVVDVDGGIVTDQDETAGLHAGGVGDAGDHTRDLEVGALLGGASLGNGGGGVGRNVNISLIILVLDQAGILDFLGAVIVLEDAVKQDLVTLDRLVLQLGVGQLAVGGIGAVDFDSAGLICDDHLTVGGVLDGLDNATDVVALGGDVAGLAALLQSLGDGDDVVLGGHGIGLDLAVTRGGVIGGSLGVLLGGNVGDRCLGVGGFAFVGSGAGEEGDGYQRKQCHQQGYAAQGLGVHSIPLDHKI